MHLKTLEQWFAHNEQTEKEPLDLCELKTRTLISLKKMIIFFFFENSNDAE